MATSPNQLERRLGLFPATNIVIANMIGAGIFTTSGLLMTDLGHPVLMIVLWIIGGIIALCGALCYGELGAAFPYAGGEYLFLSRIFHPLPGFLSGWVSFIVGFSAPIAASAIGFSEYLTSAFPQIVHNTTPIHPALGKKIIALFVLAGFTFLHLRGLEIGARVQNILTLLKIALILALVSFGFLIGNGDLNHITHIEPVSLDFGNIKTIGLSLIWIMFAYSGWNASTYIGSELKNPGKTLPDSLFLGTGIVILLYALLNVFYVYAVPADDMKGVISIGGLAASHVFGQSIGNVFSLLIAFALFSSLSAFIILGPRVYYSMAKDGLFFASIAKIHPVYKTPARSILLQGGIAGIMIFTGTFDQILTYMGFSLGIFPLLTVFALLKYRRTGARIFSYPGYHLAPAGYILVAAVMLILTFFERPVESGIAVATVLAGLPAYLLFRRTASLLH